MTTMYVEMSNYSISACSPVCHIRDRIPSFSSNRTFGRGCWESRGWRWRVCSRTVLEEFACLPPTSKQNHWGDPVCVGGINFQGVCQLAMSKDNDKRLMFRHLWAKSLVITGFSPQYTQFLVTWVGIWNIFFSENCSCLKEVIMNYKALNLCIAFIGVISVPHVSSLLILRMK